MDTAERLEVKQLGLNVSAETLSKCGLCFENRIIEQRGPHGVSDAIGEDRVGGYGSTAASPIARSCRGPVCGR